MDDGREGRALRPSVVAALAVAVLSAGCTIQMYPGPRLPREETARLAGYRASINNIDGLELPVGSVFMLLAGTHAVAVTATDASGRRVGEASICFVAKSGGNYLLGVRGHDAKMVDVGTDLLVPTTPIAAGALCPMPNPARRPVLAAEPATRIVPGATASSDAAGPEADGGEAQARSSSAAMDAERAFREKARVKPRWLIHPGTGFTIDLGAFGGGTDLATASASNGDMTSLSGGSGGYIGVGLMLTPLWLGDVVGFGADAFAGIKYDSVGTPASISLMRYPLGLGLHVLQHIADRWWIILRGGIIKETGITLSESYDPDVSLAGSLGGFGEGGVYYVFSGADSHVALVCTFRYSVSKDSANGETISANSAGALVAFHFNF